MGDEAGVRATRRKPHWLKIRPPAGESYKQIKRTLQRHNLHTVCEEAGCPNMDECWGGGTATIMILGDVCTRGCRFCAVTSGDPQGEVDRLEPGKVARVIYGWGLNYVVLTSVARDDLPHGGADHFARTICAIKEQSPKVSVEVLIPDFQGNVEALKRVAAAQPDVVGHNVETVERLTSAVRDRRATYGQSLAVLAKVKQVDSAIYTKSSLMLGLGERGEEILQTMGALRSAGVDFLTLGQYLQPTKRHLEVKEYVHPERFEDYRRLGEEMGFLYVASGPLVRSSYRAGEFFIQALQKPAERRQAEGE